MSAPEARLASLPLMLLLPLISQCKAPQRPIVVDGAASQPLPTPPERADAPLKESYRAVDSANRAAAWAFLVSFMTDRSPGRAAHEVRCPEAGTLIALGSPPDTVRFVNYLPNGDATHSSARVLFATVTRERAGLFAAEIQLRPHELWGSADESRLPCLFSLERASPPVLDTTSFRLVKDAGGYVLVDSETDTIPVPTALLAPPGEGTSAQGSGEDDDVGAIEFDPAVTAFEVGDRQWGLHLSSYAIQAEGSAGAASGRDLFLLIDRATGTVEPPALDFGRSKGRHRYLGCWEALHHRFVVADIDADGFLDVGAQQERVVCELDADGIPSSPRGRYEEQPLRWYRFTGSEWSRSLRYDGVVPPVFEELPLIGLTTSPVDFVLER